jgi:anaerobic dimethyl sulfoxide reductase subunit B (iron-sulfur subunit)
MSCAVEHDFPEGRNGIKVFLAGPWQIDKNHWQNDYMPVLTDECDLCAARTGKGKKPLCVKHCQSLVMEYGPVQELAKKIDGKTKYALFVPKAGTIE